MPFGIISVKMTADEPNPQTGIPRWLLIAFGAKLALVTIITAVIVWWANV